MPKNKIILFCFLFSWIGLHPIAAISLEKQSTVGQKIRQAIQGKNATVGVAFSIDGQLFTFNDEHRYPLMSVFKLHVAIAALQKMENECIALDSLRFIESSQIHKDTYSPLRELYPERNFYLSYADLMRYAVSQSDNNACDIIISMAGGIEGVNAEMRAIGLADYSLSETEISMQADPMRSYDNCSTPLSVAILFKKLFEENILGEPYATLLKHILISTTTGQDKIKAALEPGMLIAHKTGTGFTLDDGTKIADNDAGVVLLPDGRRIYISALVKDSKLGSKENAKLIADMARIIIRDAVKK